MNQKVRANLLRQLRRLAVERRPEACLGCGHEHDCSIHGCAVIRKAAEVVADDDRTTKPDTVLEVGAYEEGCI